MQNIDFDKIPLFRELDRLERASLLPSLDREEHPAGHAVVRQGESGDALYVILAGKVRVSRVNEQGERSEVASLGLGECFGEMALLSGAPRRADVIAINDLVLLKLSKKGFEKLFLKHPSVSAHLSVLLARRFASDPTGPGRPVETDSDPAGSSLLTGDHHPASFISKGGVTIRGLFTQSSTIALAVTLLLCMGAYTILSAKGLSQSHVILITLLLGATILWSMDVFSYHAVTVALPLLAVLFGIAAPEKAFSGFSSPSWFLVLGVFAISAAIARTGLMYRLVLLIVRRFPPGYRSQTFALAVSGLILTPVIPSSNGRAALAGPLALTICETLRFKRGSPGAIGIAMACLLGFGHMSFMFMNGTATCFLALGLLPPEIGRSVTWTSWLVSALPLGGVYFIATFVGIIVLYAPKQTTVPQTEVINAQLKALGPMTRHEGLSLFTVIVTLIAFATQSLHQINGAWIAMLSFLLLFAGNVLNEKNVRNDIDWNFMISFGALVGFGTLISASGLTAVTAEKLRPYLLGISGSPYLFLPVVSIATHLVRFALPLPAALLVGILSVVPISATVGIHPFVIALVLLISVNPWLVPYQNSIYLNMLESTEGKVFTHHQVRKLAALHIAAVLLAVVISIPYWQFSGLIK
jgi:branched-chain amino acid transport system substrate-binding protein